MKVKQIPMSDWGKQMYQVLTWDPDLSEWSPQRGVPSVCDKWGLRRILRQLRAIGYSATRGDPSVRVVKLEE